MQIDIAARTEEENGKQTDGRRKRWLVPAVALLAVSLAVAVWYLRRPLPPSRITGEYVQITHDGQLKDLAGTDGSRLYFTRDNVPQTDRTGCNIRRRDRADSNGIAESRLRDVSPDGSSLLVSSFAGGEGSLWSVQIPEGSLRQLMTGIQVNSAAAWSPDGRSVVYTGNNDVYVIQSDGTGLRRLADVGGPSSTVSWSPDGSRIRFFKGGRLWEMSSDGSGLRELLPGWRPSSPLCCGRWTPDGKFFVFLLQHPFFTRLSTRKPAMDSR